MELFGSLLIEGAGAGAGAKLRENSDKKKLQEAEGDPIENRADSRRHGEKRGQREQTDTLYACISPFRRDRPIERALSQLKRVEDRDFVTVEEGHHRPPGDHVQAVHDVRDACVLLAVSLSYGIHPVLHLLEGVTDLVIAPVAVDEPPEAHGHGTQVVLEARVVAPRGCVLVDDHLWPVHVQPDVRLPRVHRVVGADQRPHLLLKPKGVRPNPVGQPNHPRLVYLIVVGTRTNVDPQRPDFTVLRVAVLVYLRVGVTMWGPLPPGQFTPAMSRLM